MVLPYADTNSSSVYVEHTTFMFRHSVSMFTDSWKLQHQRSSVQSKCITLAIPIWWSDFRFLYSNHVVYFFVSYSWKRVLMLMLMY